MLVLLLRISISLKEIYLCVVLIAEFSLPVNFVPEPRNRNQEPPGEPIQGFYFLNYCGLVLVGLPEHRAKRMLATDRNKSDRLPISVIKVGMLNVVLNDVYGVLFLTVAPIRHVLFPSHVNVDKTIIYRASSFQFL